MLPKDVLEKYQTKEIINPSPELKEKAYYLGKAEYYFGLYARGRGTVGYDSHDKFEVFRSYGRGDQSKSKYYEWAANDILSNLDDGGGSGTSGIPLSTDGVWNSGYGINTSGSREGWVNVMWDIMSPMQKIKKAIKGKLSDVDYSIYVDLVDEESIKEQRKKKNKAKLQAEHAEFERAFKQNAGIPYKEPSLMPMDDSELDYMEEDGLFKSDLAIPFEKLLEHSFTISKWNTRLKDMLIDDLIDLGIAVTKDYINPVTQMWESKYVNPGQYIGQYTPQNQYDYTEYAGHWELRTLAELVPYGLDKEKLKAVAFNYRDYYASTPSRLYGTTDGRNVTGTLDNYLIPVIELQFLDSDIKKYKKRNLRRGDGFALEKVDATYSPNANEKKKIKQGYLSINQVSIQKTYKVSWIPGTDIIFDYGEVNFMNRPQKSEATTDYHVYQIPGQSITEQSIPILDQIQLSWLSYQNAVATSFEDITAIDVGMINNIKSGKRNMNPLEIMSFARKTGVLPFMQSYSGAYKGGAVSPIHNIPGGMGQRLNEFVAKMETFLSLLENITGVSQVAVGSQPDPKAPVGTTELAVQGTNTVLRPVVDGVLRMKELISPSLTQRIQLYLKEYKPARKVYGKVIGNDDIQKVVDAYGNGVELGFEYVAKPDQYEKSVYLNFLEVAAQNGRDNAKDGISIDSQTKAIQMLNGGENLKELWKYLRGEVRRYNKKRNQEAAENAQQQAQLTQQAAQAKAQGDAQLQQMKTQGDAYLKQLETQSAIAQKQAEYNIERFGNPNGNMGRSKPRITPEQNTEQNNA